MALFGYELYTNDDRREIKSWIKSSDDKLRGDMKNLDAFVNQQLSQYDAEFKSQLNIFQSELNKEISSLKRDITSLRISFASAVEVDALKKEVGTLKYEIDSLKPSIETDVLKKDMVALKAELAVLKNIPKSSTSSDALKQELVAIKAELAALKQSPAQSAEIAAIKSELAALKQSPAQGAETDLLKKEIFNLRQFNAAILQELEKLKAIIAKLISPPPPPPDEPPEKIFFLPEQKDVFISNEREKISEQIKQALNVSDIEKYLKANPSETSKKFQKLLDNHVKEVKKFIDKLKVNDLDDEELSENITTKYFKLFQRIIFDNILIAIKRAPKNSEKFYSGSLGKINEYLTRCGIYNVHTTARRKAEAEDYENMKPQVIKTDDKNLSETIKEIERLPYRINYLDEFGEQKALQYSGVMNIYKAV